MAAETLHSGRRVVFNEHARTIRIESHFPPAIFHATEFISVVPALLHYVRPKMDKLTVLRSVHHPSTQHSSSVHLIKTGYYCRPESDINEMPSIGSHIARQRGSVAAGVPTYVTLNKGARYGNGFYLGAGTNPFDVRNVWTGNDYENPSDTRIVIPNLSLVEGLTFDLIADRRNLLANLDTARRIVDRQGSGRAERGLRS